VTPPGFFASLALVQRTYAGKPAALRLHAVGRFLTCPFLRVLAVLFETVPPGARLLDLGTGHGTFARLAVEGFASSAVAIEPDVRKVLATYRHPRVRFVAGYAETISGNLSDTSTFDAVTIFDVLYRIPVAGWDPLLRLAYDRLAPGGVLLLKEIDPEHRAKALWNRAQEKMADLLGMTLGDAFSYETRDQLRERLTRLGFERFEARAIGAGYPHAHILYTARRPGS
jgi:SAM-dependent methyltransferase